MKLGWCGARRIPTTSSLRMCVDFLFTSQNGIEHVAYIKAHVIAIAAENRSIICRFSALQTRTCRKLDIIEGARLSLHARCACRHACMMDLNFVLLFIYFLNVIICVLHILTIRVYVFSPFAPWKNDSLRDSPKKSYAAAVIICFYYM